MSRSAGPPVNILLVDDRVENLIALEAVLQPLGENLLRAHSGEEALRRLLHEDVAVILLDVQMPGLDGFETAAHIKQRERTRQIPIIFLTAISGEPSHAARGYSAGAVDYITKPFDPWVLQAKVSVFIELHRKSAQLAAQAEQLQRQLQERKEAEEALARQADELRRANEELEHFGAIASLDVAVPLHNVRGYMQLLALDHGDALDADGRDLVARAMRSVDEMRALVDDLVLFAQTGAVTPTVEAVDCTSLVHEVLESQSDAIDEASARVIVEALPEVRSDAFLLRPVFDKLVANSLKRREGDVGVRIQISAERAPRAWHFTVADNGNPVPRDEAEQVFEVTRSRRRSAEYPGTGIGLAIAKRVVERLGGRIWVDPEAGGGAAFRFSLPDPA